jgi:putative ABC transport system permease protein
MSPQERRGHEPAEEVSHRGADYIGVYVQQVGLLRVAYKLLVNDKGKFAALLIGITFAVFLIVEMTSVFTGILRKASSTITNTGATIWVMDPGVKSVANSIPVPDYVLDGVRSIPGVKYAVPLFSGIGLIRLSSGTYQPVTVIGLDDTSLLGRPDLFEGHIEDIYAENGFIVVKDEEYAKLERPKLGDEFQINDRRGIVVGLGKVPASGLFGMPTLYTTYSRAVQVVPSARFTISYVLVEPKDRAAIPGIKRAVEQLGYIARTEGEFIKATNDFYTYHTGLGTNILLMTVISFLVGLSISGQTFYSFTLENIDKFGALKAIGARGRELVAMILFQVGLTSLAGYGLGIGLAALLIFLAKLRLPDYASLLTFTNLGIAFGMVLVIAALSSYLAIRRVLRVQPFEVFRA